MKKLKVVGKPGRKYRDMGITRKHLDKHISDIHKDFYIYPFNNNLAVNKNGVVLRVDKDEPIPVGKDSNERNYIQTFIIENGVKRRINYYPYRLVAYMFVFKPLKYANTPYSELEVNHKDGNKTNDNIKNLEWVDTKENIQHAYNNDLNTRADKIICKHLDTGSIITFRSINSAAEYFNLSTTTIRKKLLDEYIYYKLANNNDEYMFKLDGSKFDWTNIPKEYLTLVTNDNSKLKDQIVIINRDTKKVIITKNKLELIRFTDINTNKHAIFSNIINHGYFKTRNYLLYPYLDFIDLVLNNPSEIEKNLMSDDNIYYKSARNIIICKNIDTGEEIYFGTAVEMGKYFNFSPDVLYKRFKDITYWNYKIDNYKFRFAIDTDWPDDFDDSKLKDIKTFDTRAIPILVKDLNKKDFRIYNSLKEVSKLFDLNYSTLKNSLNRKDKYIVGFLEISYAK